MTLLVDNLKTRFQQKISSFVSSVHWPYCTGVDRFLRDLRVMIGYRHVIWRKVMVIFWKYLSPATLLVSQSTKILFHYVVKI